MAPQIEKIAGMLSMQSPIVVSMMRDHVVKGHNPLDAMGLIVVGDSDLGLCFIKEVLPDHPWTDTEGMVRVARGISFRAGLSEIVGELRPDLKDRLQSPMIPGYVRTVLICEGEITLCEIRYTESNRE